MVSVHRVIDSSFSEIKPKSLLTETECLRQVAEKNIGLMEEKWQHCGKEVNSEEVKIKLAL
jgi:hypothetical protein